MPFPTCLTCPARLPANTGALSRCDVADYSAGDDRAPLVVAVESVDESDVFECPAYAPGLYSERQLKAWAELVACVLLVVRWEKSDIHASVLGLK